MCTSWPPGASPAEAAQPLHLLLSHRAFATPAMKAASPAVALGETALRLETGWGGSPKSLGAIRSSCLHRHCLSAKQGAAGLGWREETQAACMGMLADVPGLGALLRASRLVRALPATDSRRGGPVASLLRSRPFPAAPRFPPRALPWERAPDGAEAGYLFRVRAGNVNLRPVCISLAARARAER